MVAGQPCSVRSIGDISGIPLDILKGSRDPFAIVTHIGGNLLRHDVGYL